MTMERQRGMRSLRRNERDQLASGSGFGSRRTRASRAGRRAERAKREALPCKNDALRRSGRLEWRWRQTAYDRAGLATLCRRHLRAGLRVLSGAGHPDRSRTLRLRHRSRVARERGTKRLRARLSTGPAATERRALPRFPARGSGYASSSPSPSRSFGHGPKRLERVLAMGHRGAIGLANAPRAKLSSARSQTAAKGSRGWSANAWARARLHAPRRGNEWRRLTQGGA
jgi:hypothetical protein